MLWCLLICYEMCSFIFPQEQCPKFTFSFANDTPGLDKVQSCFYAKTGERLEHWTGANRSWLSKISAFWLAAIFEPDLGHVWSFSARTKNSILVLKNVPLLAIMKCEAQNSSQITFCPLGRCSFAPFWEMWFLTERQRRSSSLFTGNPRYKNSGWWTPGTENLSH